MSDYPSSKHLGENKNIKKNKNDCSPSQVDYINSMNKSSSMNLLKLAIDSNTSAVSTTAKDMSKISMRNQSNDIGQERSQTYFLGSKKTVSVNRKLKK